MVRGDKLASLTVLSHQTVGCARDGFYKARQEVEGGQEALGAKLVAELKKREHNESKLTLQSSSSTLRQQLDHCLHYGYYHSTHLFSSIVGITS